jgi:hypothetical protein
MQFTDNPISEVADVKHDDSYDNVVEMFAKMGEPAVTKPDPLNSQVVPVVFVVNAGSMMHAKQIVSAELLNIDLVLTDVPGVITWIVGGSEN